MFSSPKRLFLAVFVLFWGFSTAFLASAQDTQDTQDTQIDSDIWGFGFLQRSKTELPAASWIMSDGQDLMTLLGAARVRGLSPAEQMLMRALVLSPATAPEGEFAGDLLAERARLMFEIGEAEAAARLMPFLSEAIGGVSRDALAIDLQFATGQAETACLDNSVALGESGDANVPPAQNVFQAKVRATCFALFDQPEDAELALEFAQNAALEAGEPDPWFAKAIYAVTGEVAQKPEARFDTGLSLALSAKAGLEPSVTSMANSRKDLAAAIAREESFAPSIRVQAAGVAAEAGLLEAKTHREIYKALIMQEGFRARTPLEVALLTAMTSGNDRNAKARTLWAALRTSRGNIGRFSAVSRLLLADLQALTPSEATDRMAVDFVYASLAAGSPDEALRWIAGWQDGAESSVKGDAFERIWSVGLVALAGVELGQSKAGESALHLESARETVRVLIEAAETAKQKAAMARLLVLWDAMGMTLPSEARAILADMESAAEEKAVSPALLTSIGAAAKAGAGAEVILRVLQLTNGDAYDLAAGDIAALVSALRALGQDEAARILALEATGYWRTSL